MSDCSDTVTNNKKREDLICDYQRALVTIDGDSSTEGDTKIDISKKKINEFKKELLACIADIRTSGEMLHNEVSDGKDMENELKIIEGKILSGTELKKNIYEENTNLTMHLIYYILGMGFMGYYIVKLLKK
tara:strand:+ start:24 stop:416 length:393 start_codon:yes stop_codon:yes gene_type:complete